MSTRHEQYSRVAAEHVMAAKSESNLRLWLRIMWVPLLSYPRGPHLFPFHIIFRSLAVIIAGIWRKPQSLNIIAFHILSFFFLFAFSIF